MFRSLYFSARYFLSRMFGGEGVAPTPTPDVQNRPVVADTVSNATVPSDALSLGGTLVRGGTYRFTLTASVNGSAWDLTGASVVLTFTSPSGTATSYSATLDDADGGTAHYDGDASVLGRSGLWRRSWRVLQGDVDVRTRPKRFVVVPAP